MNPAIEGGRDPAKEKLFTRPGFLIRRLHQIHVAMFLEELKAQTLAPGITPVQFGLMTAVAALPGLDQTALGQEIGLDRTTTADVVKRLEQRQLVERIPSASDRRTRHVHLTAKGQRVVDELQPEIIRSQERLLEPLRPAEKLMLMDLMQRLVEANNQYSRTVLRGI